MKVTNDIHRQSIAAIVVICALISSCVPSQGRRPSGLAKDGSSISNGGAAGSGGDGFGGGSSAVDPGGASGSSTLISQKVELSHLVDPFDGTYKKKLTLPKNFKGNLYLAGLNISSLTNKIVYVRFNFGVEKQSITLGATIARAPGIIPKTDIQVLVVDMNKSPFAKMRLGYDLYDYNTYDPSDTTKDVVTDPRNGNLYCRGLRLDDDPTFIPQAQTSTCSSGADKCLYSYAKLVDSTLYSGNLTNIPTRPQVWTESSGVRTPSLNDSAGTVCLPDDSDVSTVNQLFDSNFMSLVYDLPILSQTYRGPYRSINDNDWQITQDAVYNATYGLFEVRSSFVGSITGYRSLLFPRAGKLSLSQGVNYLGSVDRIGARSKMVSNSSGTSNYVDGCNLRVMNYDPASNEGIGSCNVNASIEIFYLSEGKEVNITSDKSIKLQLIRPSLTNYLGKEVLNSAFKRCENSSTCGSDECCFNSRCWSKDLVTQCVDQTPVIGNQEIGSNCTSDFECSSLCCNQATGSCSPHNPSGSNPIFCSKSAGQQCVSKEFCKQEAVVTCKIVKSGFKADGTAACTLRCPAVMTFGDCKSGLCVPPLQPAVPEFDPNDCSKAVDP